MNLVCNPVNTNDNSKVNNYYVSPNYWCVDWQKYQQIVSSKLHNCYFDLCNPEISYELLCKSLLEGAFEANIANKGYNKVYKSLL